MTPPFLASYLVDVSLTGGAGGLSSSSDMLKGGKGWPNVLNLAAYIDIQNNKFPSGSSTSPRVLFLLFFGFESQTSDLRVKLGKGQDPGN
ncbi:hypothetical protein E2C01_008841 [Portunus trituberculatus]|uniref:Uncharacterized protein n=1 Tax=Portunus trituberculatus TaxID=210409 RepID=A0A5B7D5M0_PORTR|nr:hypothetical protein [Portunus trituberculatus]